MSGPDEIPSTKGNIIPRRLSVDDISFSAHVDFSQNSEFIEAVKAKHIVNPSTRFIGYCLKLIAFFRTDPRSWRADGHGSP